MRKPIIITAILFYVIACQPTPTATQMPPPSLTPTLPLDESGPNFLLSSSNAVRLNRDGWADYTPVAFGTLLHPTDLLQVEDEVKVLCGNENELWLETVPNGEHRVPCPPGIGILSYGGALFSARRLGIANASAIPFIFYPRNTLLLTDRPTLYWNDTGASRYTVALEHGGQSVWVVEAVIGNSLAYPADKSPLESGKDYRLVVIDKDSEISSREDEPAGTGFRLATDEEKAKIEADLGQIESVEGLSGPDLNFALAVYYAGLEPSEESGFSPLGEAWLILEGLAAMQDAPAIHLWYGDVLSRLKLPDEAEIIYENALEYAEGLGDLETQGAANARLWCITDEEDHFNEAVRLYGELGDQSQVEMLQAGKDNWKAVCKVL